MEIPPTYTNTHTQGKKKKICFVTLLLFQRDYGNYTHKPVQNEKQNKRKQNSNTRK